MNENYWTKGGNKKGLWIGKRKKKEKWKKDEKREKERRKNVPAPQLKSIVVSTLSAITAPLKSIVL